MLRPRGSGHPLGSPSRRRPDPWTDWPPDVALAPEPELTLDSQADPWPDLPVHDEPSDLWDVVAPFPDDLDRAEGGGARGAWVTPGMVECAADGLLDPRSAFDVLSDVDLASLDGPSRVDVVRGLERLMSVLSGWQQWAIAGVADASADLGLDREEARHEIGAALHLAPVTAGQRTAVAVALRERHPDTLAALCEGRVSWRQAANLVDGLADVPDATADAVESQLLTRMPGQTASETRRAVRDAVVRIDPRAAADKLTAATRDRRIDRIDQADGTRAWWSPFAPDLEHDLWSALTRRAQALRSALRSADPAADLPSLDALRVDALGHAILGRTVPGAATPGRTTPGMTTPGMTTPGITTPGTPMPGVTPAALSGITTPADPTAVPVSVTPGPLQSDDGTTQRQPQPQQQRVPRCMCGGAQTAAVVVDLPTLLNLADNPGHLAGYGTIPAGLARAMAADRDWVRWTTEPGTRHLIDRGAETYRPSDPLRAFIIARDRVCGFPGCHRPARECDCDHVVAYRTPDGRTVEVNLGPLCRQHHNAKTHGRWQLRYDPVARTKTWRSPLGKTYVTGTDPPLA
ncbi:MAG TPA: DUF222 domain-containing protein [Actinomycetes bacterium]|nr:DUF222 domain-containing protein [Actinomycetes bacterium]